jgi:hypothetical protein
VEFSVQDVDCREAIGVSRHAAIYDRERIKTEISFECRLAFALEREVFHFIRGQEGNYDTLGPERVTPSGELIVQPVAAAGARGDRQTSAMGPLVVRPVEGG